MKTITCKCGQSIFLDDEIGEFITQTNWQCSKGVVYILKGARKRFKNKITLVSLLVGVGMFDHKDRNYHNNQKENLRPTNYSLNGANRGISKNNTSGYKGVSWHTRDHRWHAQIVVDRKTKHLGTFTNKETAAYAYDKAAKQHFGAFALTNF